jgi:hypothetical protein
MKKFEDNMFRESIWQKIRNYFHTKKIYNNEWNKLNESLTEFSEHHKPGIIKEDIPRKIRHLNTLSTQSGLRKKEYNYPTPYTRAFYEFFEENIATGKVTPSSGIELIIK